MDDPLFELRGWRVTDRGMIGGCFFIAPQRMLAVTDFSHWRDNPLAGDPRWPCLDLYTWPVRIVQRNEDLEAFKMAFLFALHRFHPQPTGEQAARLKETMAFAQEVRRLQRLRLRVIGEVHDEWGFEGLGGIDEFNQEVDRRLAELRPEGAPDG
jgi:hypothetical protein